jgi:hypothetical protein
VCYNPLATSDRGEIIFMLALLAIILAPFGGLAED